MMSMDRDKLAEFFGYLSDKYYGHEIIERLETAGIITVSDVLAALEDQIIEGQKFLYD